MSQVQMENLADYLHRCLPAQGFKLLHGSGAIQVAGRLTDLGHSVICLSEAGDTEAEMRQHCQGLRVVKGSLLNVPYHDFLQSVLVINAFDRIEPFHWHALPEVFARALRAGGSIFIGALREPGCFTLLKDIDRLMRESGFIRVHQAQLHFDIPELEALMGAWWEKWAPDEQDETMNRIL